jgi:hypothetical protein
MSDRWVYIDVERVAKETLNAFLFVIDGEDVWIPKSQMADPDDYSEGDADLTAVAITDWIARERGLA